MVRRSAGFVSKRSHKKSRGGCLTCKKKKVKCDEVQPTCSYCTLRKIECTWPQDSPRDNSSLDSTRSYDEIIEFSAPIQVPLWLTPAVNTSAGQLNSTELKYLHLYKTSVWPNLSLQQDEVISRINRDWVPQTSLSYEHMLYSILCISASHQDHYALPGTSNARDLALMWRGKALASYNKALSNITSENYESLLITSMWMMIMSTPPQLPCSDDTCLEWASSLFILMQGLRILASLKWASGIEKLVIYPLFRRELKKLPPPPMLSPLPEWFYSSNDNEWNHPNSPGDTYTAHPTPPETPSTSELPQSSGVQIDTSKLPYRPQKLMSASDSPHAPPSWKGKHTSWELPAPAFLPPSLMALLQSLVDPSQTGPMDFDRPILIPVLHALSPIFLSLYYYRLTTDLFVRIFVLPTYLTPEFLALVRTREPRALVLSAWYFALMSLLPQTNKWYTNDIMARVLQAVSNVVIRTCDVILINAMEGAYRLVKTQMREGREAAARTIFNSWEGVIWEEGPSRERQWREAEMQQSIVETDAVSSA